MCFYARACKYILIALKTNFECEKNKMHTLKPYFVTMETCLLSKNLGVGLGGGTKTIMFYTLLGNTHLTNKKTEANWETRATCLTTEFLSNALCPSGVNPYFQNCYLRISSAIELSAYRYLRYTWLVVWKQQGPKITSNCSKYWLISRMFIFTN